VGSATEGESPARRRVALLLEYDGTDFAGSQAQAGRRTVQGALEAAIAELTGERLRVAFAGRTDSGVHASAQVAAFDTASEHSPATFRRALNHFLPEDLAVRAVADVAREFNLRRDAAWRVYRYAIRDGGARSPLLRRSAWQVDGPLDLEAMSEALRLLPPGPVDWAAFAGPVPAGYPTVRTVRCAAYRCDADRVTVTAGSEGFLPHQVRRVVGALERVGRGTLEPGAFAKLLDGPPSSAGPAAPPQGLTLQSVCYPAGAVIWDE
jgi:tRNA pseudouridine38-40 synthase